MTLDRYIATLLEDHDCVIVPDFGGFVANYAKAKINPINHRFDPPHRKVSFNKFLIHNDGLLAAYVAQKEQEKYEQAVERIKHYTVYLKKSLREKGRVEIDRVGILMQLKDGTFRFEQVKNAGLFKEGFGLDAFFGAPIERSFVPKPSIEPKTERKTPITPEPEVKETPVVRLEPEVEKAPLKEEAVADPLEAIRADKNTQELAEEPITSRKRSWVPAAAAALLAPIVGYGLWVAIATPIFSDQQHFHVSDLNPFSTKICPIYTARDRVIGAGSEEVEVVHVVEHGDYLELRLDNEADKTMVVRLSEKKTETPVHSADLRYHIIGGCFGVESNAHGLVETYRKRGSNAAIIDQRGALHRVSIASFATKKEAEQKLASFQKDIPGAWLLYK